MITLLLVISILLVGGIYLYSNRKNYLTEKEDQWEDITKEFQFSKFIKPLAVILILLLVSLFQPYSIERVDSGYKGVKVNLTGSSRGVQNYQYKTGWVTYNSWTEQLLEFPIFQQHVEYDDQIVITKGGFSATIKPTFNYSLKEENIGDMFVNLRLSMSEIQSGWLKTAIVGAVNDVANKWEVDKIFNQREEFELAIVTECNKRISKWFTVSQLRTNIIPPASLQEAIESKTKAIQQAEAEKQKAITANAEAQKKIAIAKGDSAQAVISASGEALATKLKQQTLTPLYIEYMKIKKWDGRLPTTQTGGSSGVMLNIK